jgi:hypothetical protein
MVMTIARWTVLDAPAVCPVTQSLAGSASVARAKLLSQLGGCRSDLLQGRLVTASATEVTEMGPRALLSGACFGSRLRYEGVLPARFDVRLCRGDDDLRLIERCGDESPRRVHANPQASRRAITPARCGMTSSLLVSGDLPGPENRKTGSPTCTTLMPTESRLAIRYFKARRGPELAVCRWGLCP